MIHCSTKSNKSMKVEVKPLVVAGILRNLTVFPTWITSTEMVMVQDPAVKS